MATCLQTITDKINNGQYNSITELLPNTLTNLSLSSTSKQLYRLTIIQQETAKFTISLVSPLSPSNVGVTINIYQYIANTVLLLGTVLVTEMILSFQKDFSVGDYLICIGSSSLSYTGTFIGQFTGYPVYAKFSPISYTGQALRDFDLEFDYVEKTCDKPLFYEIVDGALPDGLQMTINGNIWGILPNMDCTPDNDDLSPSQNWYYEMDNTWQPWGRQWRFKIKVWIFDYPDAWTERWFCIRVHNNWSWDRDNIQPIEYEEEIVEETFSEPFVSDCCEKPEPVVFVPQSLPISLCPCETETPAEQAIILNFLQWYDSVLKNPPGEDNPYIQTFIDNFQKTDYFKTLIEKAGLSDTLLTSEEKELKAVNSLIEYYNNQLIGGQRREEDIDYVMLQLRDEENQKLPITILSQSGSYLTIEDLYKP